MIPMVHGVERESKKATTGRPLFDMRPTMHEKRLKMKRTIGEFQPQAAWSLWCSAQSFSAQKPVTNELGD
jgi:hypothetical protein